MANFIIPRTRRVIPIRSEQVHPRVLTVDRECCSCTYSQNPATANNINFLYCTHHGRNVGRYDECSAFQKVNE